MSTPHDPHSQTALASRHGTSATSSPRRRAAFYDLDGTLVRTNVVHAYAYYALSHPSWTRKVTGVASMVANMPLWAAMDKYGGRKLFNEYFYKGYRGFTEDRLVIVGEEVFDKVLRPAIFPGVYDLIARSREQGLLQVLVTGALDTITAPLARHLGIDVFIANRLEIVRGEATGRLLPPVLAGPNKSLVMRQYAREHNIDLDQSFAYADSYSDFPMLSMVGHPVAVNPDRELRRAAADFSWPVISVADS